MFISSHLHISSSHLRIFSSSTLRISSSHLHIFSSSASSHLHISFSHLLIFSSSRLHIIFSSSHLLIFTSFHLHIYTYHLLIASHLLIHSSSHLHISSSHLHICTSSHLHILTFSLSPSPMSCFYLLSLGRGWCQRGAMKCNPFTRNEVQSAKNEVKLRFNILNGSPFAAFCSFCTKSSLISKNWGKIAI